MCSPVFSSDGRSDTMRHELFTQLTNSLHFTLSWASFNLCEAPAACTWNLTTFMAGKCDARGINSHCRLWAAAERELWQYVL